MSLLDGFCSLIVIFKDVVIHLSIDINQTFLDILGNHSGRMFAMITNNVKLIGVGLIAIDREVLINGNFVESEPFQCRWILIDHDNIYMMAENKSNDQE